MKQFFIILGLLFTTSFPVFSQQVTAAPFLLNIPDPASLGIGDAGLATDCNASAMFFNPAKINFSKKKIDIFTNRTNRYFHGVRTHYRYFSGYYQITNKHAIGIHYRYYHWDMKSMYWDSFLGGDNLEGLHSTLGLSYTQKLNKYFSIGTTISHLYDGERINFTKPTDDRIAKTWIADIGAYYQKSITKPNMDFTYSLGMAIVNIGKKIKYSNDSISNFLPTNLGLGGAMKIRLYKYLLINPALDFNKLLVPSAGGDTQIPYIKGILKSGFDAQGGFNEELQEIRLSTGSEIGAFIPFNQSEKSYLKLLLRAGYGRKVLTYGAGIELSIAKFTLGADISSWKAKYKPPYNSRTVGINMGYLL